MSQPLKIFRDWRLLEQHPAFKFWLCFAPMWWLLPKGFFLEYGDPEDPMWWQIYYIWEFSVPVAFMAMVSTYQRYFLLVLSPILIFSIICLLTECVIFVWQLDPNSNTVTSLKFGLLHQCGVSCLFCLILLEIFPWENLPLQIGP